MPVGTEPGAVGVRCGGVRRSRRRPQPVVVSARPTRRSRRVGGRFARGSPARRSLLPETRGSRSVVSRRERSMGVGVQVVGPHQTNRGIDIFRYGRIGVRNPTTVGESEGGRVRRRRTESRASRNENEEDGARMDDSLQPSASRRHRIASRSTNPASSAVSHEDIRSVPEASPG